MRWGCALAALAGQSNGEPGEASASQLEVAVLGRARGHRTFRRIGGARLDELLAAAAPGSGRGSGRKAAAQPPGDSAGTDSAGTDSAGTDSAGTDSGAGSGDADGGGAG